MKNLFILSFGVFILIHSSAISQVSLGPKIGLNLSTFSGDNEYCKIRLRAHMGGVLNIGINNMFSVQPGLIVSGKGATLDYENDDDIDAYTLWYLELPLNGVVNFKIGQGAIQIYLGPYVGYCFGGKYKHLSDENNETEDINIGTSGDDEIKPIDFGINIGLGYQIKGFQFQAGYGGSGISIANYEGGDLKNNVISFSFAYLFKLSK